MKTVIVKSVCSTLFISFLFLISYSKASEKATKMKPEPKTFASVRHAINAEKMAYNYYIACAKQAKDAGSKSIANTYEVIAKQENEHYLRFKDIARRMKIKYVEDDIVVPMYTILENVNKSVEIEINESSIYDEAFKTALKERYRYARKSFEWALDMEKLHIEAFKNLLTKLSE